MPIEPSVFVVDDDPAVRDSLRWLVESTGLKVETFRSAPEFLAHFDPERPGCLVLDLRMPTMSGLELQAELAARHATLPLIMMTGYATARTAVDALKRGAFDFIPKPFRNEHILERIRAAIAADLRAHHMSADRAALRLRQARLTRRERQVLDRIVAARTEDEIAAELGVKKSTIGFHRARLCEKLGVRTVAELVRLCEIGRRGTS
jgi:FixJ family two-component response regulator